MPEPPRSGRHRQRVKPRQRSIDLVGSTSQIHGGTDIQTDGPAATRAAWVGKSQAQRLRPSERAGGLAEVAVGAQRSPSVGEAAAGPRKHRAAPARTYGGGGGSAVAAGGMCQEAKVGSRGGSGARASDRGQVEGSGRQLQGRRVVSSAEQQEACDLLPHGASGSETWGQGPLLLRHLLLQGAGMKPSGLMTKSAQWLGHKTELFFPFPGSAALRPAGWAGWAVGSWGGGAGRVVCVLSLVS